MSIHVTKTYLPPLDEYIGYLQRIWESNQLTNNGPFVRELETKLKDYLGVKHLFFVSNGTIALQIAIKALGSTGEIITTPFSYVATTSAIVWEGCRPVYVDIDPETLCLDPALIENAISEHTIAILATHVYGYPCNVVRIQEIAHKYGLKVIYDAAHVFGVRYKNVSLASYGDISTLSFHATKLFHTVEGGAIVTQDDELAQKLEYMRRFGHKGQEDFWGLGINGKNSEFHAAMGLCVLSRAAELIRKRKTVSEVYDKLLTETGLTRLNVCDSRLEFNYGYYPILFKSEKQLLKSKAELNARQIFPRRYFYPSLNQLDYIERQTAPISEDIAPRILCLPLYDDLTLEQLSLICTTLEHSL